MNTVGFLHNLWDRVEEIGEIIDSPQGQAIAARFPTEELAQQFLECAHNPEIWVRPLSTSVTLKREGTTVHLIR